MYVTTAAASASVGLLAASAIVEHQQWQSIRPDLLSAAWLAAVEVPALWLLFWLMRHMSATRMTTRFLLAPLIAGIAIRHGRANAPAADGTVPDRPPLLPPFIIAFVAMVAVASLGIIPDRVLVRIDDLRTVLLGMALFALGTRVNVGRLRQIGARPLVLG